MVSERISSYGGRLNANPEAPRHDRPRRPRCTGQGRPEYDPQRLQRLRAKDVESPLGEWTKCDVLARGDTLEYRVNGQIVNRARGLTFTRGKLLIQTEGAEIWYRDLKLTPLK